MGYMSFPVREYRRPPLRCYKCQRFGHTAAACRGDRRCGGGGDHDFKQCQVKKTKCCNCGGNHITSRAQDADRLVGSGAGRGVLRVLQHPLAAGKKKKKKVVLNFYIFNIFIY